MSSREKILRAVRRHVVTPVAEPSLDENWIRYPNPVEQFSAMLESVGGQSRRVVDLAALRADLEQLAPCQNAHRRFIGVDGAGQGNVRMHEVNDPHELENVEFAILPAELGVAENAALWVTADGLEHRAIFFIVQHLALVVPADRIVHNLHEAYAQLEIGAPGYGCFISGPSKTADIEQSLVIGAHGARSLTVYIVGRQAEP